jgi:sugar lactone lactonase YvrE
LIRSLPAALVAALLCLAPRAAGAAATRIWVSDSAADFSAGEARGVSVTVEGALVLSDGLERVDGIAEAAIFDAARDAAGNMYLATGDAGKVLRISPTGKVEPFGVLSEKEVTAVAVGPDGAVYAAAAPGGKIYRFDRSGKPLLYYDSKAQYVWSLAFSGDVLYAGTGLPGEIHKVTGALQGQRVHAAPDPHVRALLADGKGRVWAGTAGSGLLLRVDPAGGVATVYDSSKSEITAIAGGTDGRVWFSAGSADAAPGGGEPISAPVTTPGARGAKPAASRVDDDGKEKAEVTVTVSAPRLAAPARPGGRTGGYSSEVLLLEDGEPARPIWTSSEELVFDLQPGREKGSVLAATGPNGKLYRLGDGTWALERTLDEKQLTVLAAGAIATNTASAFYRWVEGARQGEYVSPVKDTGRTSRFGAFRWEGETPPGARAEFAFRSGESATPDGTWSPWSRWTSDKQVATLDLPPGRYLQWKLRLQGSEGSVPRIRRVEAAYRNRNAMPVVESFTALGPSEVFARSASGGSNVFESTAPDEKGIFTSLEEAKPEGAPRKLMRKGYRTLTWKAADADGDTLTYDLDLKPGTSERWVPLRAGLRENFYSFDTTSLPDGDYVFRLKASDAEDNPEEKKVVSRETGPVRLDNTAPAIRRLSNSAGQLEFEAVDSGSPILEAEYSVDAKEWIRVEPRDGLSDSMTERYTVSLDPAARGGFLLIRVTDTSRNVSAASFTSP